jgi:small subunit ribosomal protein S4
MYGVLEKQFRHFFLKVSRKKGASGELLLKLLESRLDNVVYRSGFSVTRAEARQLVSHKSISIVRNGIEKIIVFPSFIVKAGDIIKITNKSKDQVRINYALKCAEKLGFVKWVDVDIKNMTSTYIRAPERKQLSSDLNEQLVVEFYSK